MSTKEKLTTVSTTYARIAVMLIALNMLLTGYAVYALNMKESQQEQQVRPEVGKDASEDKTTVE